MMSEWVNINIMLFSYTRAFSDGSRNFESWSSDEDDICELTLPLLTSTPTGGRLSIDRSNVHHPLHCGFSVVLGSNSCHAGHESVTLTTRLLRPTKKLFFSNGAEDGYFYLCRPSTFPRSWYHFLAQHHIGEYQLPQVILTPSFLPRRKNLSSDDVKLYLGI
ncbi:hypothetical protein TNCV_4933131 [Trichonephila clavipes]|nr:hypothetical protein TNCV_4933131 [Trichonephila clavipes]